MMGPLQVWGSLLATSFASCLFFHTYQPKRPILIICLLIIVPASLSRFTVTSYNALVGFALTSTAYWSLLSVFTIIHRISPFHPLAKYPGPILDRITQLQTLRICTSGNLHGYRQKLHHEYGDIVRIGPNDLSYANVDGVQSVLGPSGLPKGLFYDNGSLKPSILMIRNPADYGSRRRLWNKGFSTASLKRYEEHVANRSRELLDQLSKSTGEPVDISKWMEFFAFDVMGNVVFNSSFNLVKTGNDERRYRQRLMVGAQITNCIARVPWLGRLLRTVTSPNHSLRSLSKGMVGERLKAGSTAKDLFYHLSQDDGEEHDRMDQERLIGEGIVAIVGGSDTTSTTMANLWYFLLKNPSYYTRLRQEVDNVFPSGEEPIDQQRLIAMSYLNACIQESMRLVQPIPSGSQRTVPYGSGGRMVGSHYIPEGTNITVHPYTIHRDSRYFSPYPTTFWPDRWLDPADRRSLYDVEKPLAKDVDVVTNISAFLPFSTGPRSCPGKHLAMIEMRVAVSYIVQSFDMRVAKGYDLDDWEGNLRDYFILSKGALPVVLTPRVLVL